jgi:hypothetical protein
LVNTITKYINSLDEHQPTGGSPDTAEWIKYCFSPFLMKDADKIKNDHDFTVIGETLSSGRISSDYHKVVRKSRFRHKGGILEERKVKNLFKFIALFKCLLKICTFVFNGG